MQDSNLLRRQYTDKFKVEAARLANSIGGREAVSLERSGRHIGQLEATRSRYRHRGI